MQAGPCAPVVIQLQKAEVGPTSGPTWRLAHLVKLEAEGRRHPDRPEQGQHDARDEVGGVGGRERAGRVPADDGHVGGENAHAAWGPQGPSVNRVHAERIISNFRRKLSKAIPREVRRGLQGVTLDRPCEAVS